MFTFVALTAAHMLAAKRNTVVLATTGIATTAEGDAPVIAPDDAPLATLTPEAPSASASAIPKVHVVVPARVTPKAAPSSRDFGAGF